MENGCDLQAMGEEILKGIKISNTIFGNWG